MKKLYLILPLALILCFMVGCQKGEEVAEEATSDELVPLDLKNAHGSWFEGLLTEDTTGLNKLLSEDVTLGFGDSVMPRATFLSLLQSGDLIYETAEHEAVGFHIHGNTAVVTGRSNLVYRFKGDEDLERLAYTAVYLRTDGEWEMVAWQSTDRDSITEVEEQNKEVVRNLLEELDKGNVRIVEKLYSSDSVYYSPSGSTTSMSREDAIESTKMFYGAFPDLAHSIEELIASGDKVVVRAIVRGTHKGEFLGVPATGNKIEFSFIAIVRIKNGKIVEEWQDIDMLGFMQQLGMELKPKEE